jgi:ketosteroid isomerase-like protein
VRAAQDSQIGERLRDTGKFIVIFRQQADGGWKATADQFNSDLPAN